jgi:DNA sulfur modification protein DndB
MDEIINIKPKTAEVGFQALIGEPTALLHHAKVRKLDFISMKVHPADEEGLNLDGWETIRRLKHKIEVKKSKPIGQHLEDRFWSLCYNMGYPIINGGTCIVTYLREDGSKGQKQIDVLSKDADTVIVAECKSKENRGRRSLQKDLHETIALQKSIANSIRSHFGGDFHPKILWLYVTHNIIWSEPDIERAASSNIRIITENELQYFEAYVAHVGAAGKYQFLSEFLQGQEIAGLANKKVPAVRGKFGKQTFFSFTITADHLLKLAFVNHHALNHPEGRPAYQRMIDRKRIKSIGEFIRNEGYFATNILVNFTENCVFEPLSTQENGIEGLRFGNLILPSKFKSAWIIDGQHRLFGFSGLEQKLREQPLFVVAFERMQTDEEAELFITINHKQKSVPKDLLVALQADLKMGSADPEEALNALCSFLIRTVGNDPTSPLFRRLAMPGVPASEDQVLTIPEIQKGLRRSTLIGRIVKKNRFAGYLTGATDEDTLTRSRSVLNGYFSIIEELLGDRWAAGRAGYVATNPSIRAHLLLINESIRYAHANRQIDPYVASPKEVVEILKPIATAVCDWFLSNSAEQVAEKFARKYGEGGVKEYFFALCEIVNSSYSDFGSEEFKQFIAQASDQRLQQAKDDVSDLTTIISTVVIETLKKEYGTTETASGEKKYWELGIVDSGIKEAAYKKQQQAKPEKRAPREAYLDIVDFEKIIKQKGNWEILKSIFNIPLPNISIKSKEYHLDWIKEFNSIRNTAAHSSIYRTLQSDDYVFLNWLKNILYDNCKASGFEVPGS